ncbi:hypothetical protein [Angelakisella massiliensis]|uniref:hypothetical protein n=1 Tax=Angelakisella massiliensis TaxID=1871018 RepID=UPI001113FACC|nr:hypothetical protein [Angelakisella massiliensis]
MGRKGKERKCNSPKTDGCSAARAFLDEKAFLPAGFWGRTAVISQKKKGEIKEEIRGIWTNAFWYVILWSEGQKTFVGCHGQPAFFSALKRGSLCQMPSEKQGKVPTVSQAV